MIILLMFFWTLGGLKYTSVFKLAYSYGDDSIRKYWVIVFMAMQFKNSKHCCWCGGYCVTCFRHPVLPEYKKVGKGACFHSNNDVLMMSTQILEYQHTRSFGLIMSMQRVIDECWSRALAKWQFWMIGKANVALTGPGFDSLPLPKIANLHSDGWCTHNFSHLFTSLLRREWACLADCVTWWSCSCSLHF